MKDKWIHLHNVYLPNTDTQVTRFNATLTNATPDSIIVGDFNGHSHLWDPVQPPDARGNELKGWIYDRNLQILNDGSPTRTSRITGNNSTLDLSICGGTWSTRTSWKTADPLGDSDHLPIQIVLHHTIRYQPVLPRKAKWRRNGVDWDKFRQVADEQMTNLLDEPILSKQMAQFTEILNSVAETHVGKTKPRKKAKPWMTPHVRAKIRIRNQLRRTINKNRQEWINACREANEAINEAKTDSWKEVLESAMTNNSDMWKVIKGLNRTPEANSPNEEMSHDGRVITDAKAKASVFVNHYARVSNLPMSAADRQLNRELKKRLDAPSTNDESCSKFTMRELTLAINKIKRKGAAGSDNIPPTFLKALGPSALQELLAIFNESFRHADCPRIWRVAVIIPILKAGKPASEVASYRPISLTSCVVKLLERMLADRLYYIAETKNLFSPFQAGSRRGRSCEDQILRIVQAIEDGFQKKPMHRSVLVLLDFSKACDTVWTTRLPSATYSRRPNHVIQRCQSHQRFHPRCRYYT